MARIRIDGMSFPLLEADEFTIGELARIEAHFGVRSNALPPMVAFVGLCWASAKRAGANLSLADVENAAELEPEPDPEDPTPAAEELEPAAAEVPVDDDPEKALAEDGARS